MSEWPDWWEWELDVRSPHLRDRMRRRSFTEIDLRDMMERASGLRPDHEPGRWVLETRFEGEEWEVIVEPDEDRKITVVITAYDVYP